MEKLAVVSSSPLFEMLSSAELAHLAELSEQRRYSAGELIFEEGERGDCLYLIARGEVELTRKDGGGVSRPLTVLGAPGFFGEMSLIDLEDRSATVRARTDTELLRLTTEHRPPSGSSTATASPSSSSTSRASCRPGCARPMPGCPPVRGEARGGSSRCPRAGPCSRR
ncbi:cyclic nucleotide-binding domain-containing protein [Cystobacter fuscus]